MRCATLWMTLVGALGVQAAEPCLNVIPRPQRVIPGSGHVVIGPATRVRAGQGARAVAESLVATLAPALGRRLSLEAGARPEAGVICLRLGTVLAESDEAYRLVCDGRGVLIEATAPAGLFYGVQTLRQLLPEAIFSDSPVAGVTWTVPAVTIVDRPRFRWRGLHLDVGRHFMPAAFIKRYIDLMALHKLNVFHWHLTEDQGWRIEIKRYPRLTEVGAWREETLVGHAGKRPYRFDGRRHGGFYTQAEVRDILAYAQARFVTVVPEIEMPGHAQAAIAAYPELGVTGATLPVRTVWGVCPNILNVEESTIQFMQNVLSEVLELFDSPFIHVGGDEAVKQQWEKSDRVQARMRELGIANEHALQSWFIGRMDRFLTEHGRRLIGWDEILEGGLAPGATVMSWRGEQGGIRAAQAGHDVVMAPNSHTYFDHYQADPKREPLAIGGFLPIDKVYGYDPIPAALTPAESAHVLGVQAQVWTEYIPTPERVEYMAFPRACALAEVAWTETARKDLADFQRRLPVQMARLHRLGVNAHPLESTEADHEPR